MALSKTQLERLKKIRVFVLDMDGTIYLGDSLFPFTKDFLQKVKETGRDFCFFTNKIDPFSIFDLIVFRIDDISYVKFMTLDCLRNIILLITEMLTCSKLGLPRQ